MASDFLVSSSSLTMASLAEKSRGLAAIRMSRALRAQSLTRWASFWTASHCSRTSWVSVLTLVASARLARRASSPA